MISPKERKEALVFARVFSVLSDPNRLLIMKLLKDGEKSVSQIAIEVNQSQPLVSHHLSALKSVGLVKTRKSGNFSFYSMGSGKAGAIFESLGEMIDDISENIEEIPFQPAFFRGRGRRGMKWM